MITFIDFFYCYVFQKAKKRKINITSSKETGTAGAICYRVAQHDHYDDPAGTTIAAFVFFTGKRSGSDDTLYFFQRLYSFFCFDLLFITQVFPAVLLSAAGKDHFRL